MSITSRVFAVGITIALLEADIARLITAGKQPVGNPGFLNNQYVQTMDAGTAPGSIESVQASVAAVATADAVVSYAANGAIAKAGAGAAFLNKTSAGAYTLAAPTADEDLEVLTGTDFAHVITATGLIKDGVTGGAKNTITFAAFAGAGIHLKGHGGFWHVLAKNGATIA